MGVSPSELVQPFLGALQASISVLVTIFIGVLTAQFSLLDGNASKQVSRTCVRILLPALLVTKVGDQLNADTAVRYAPILIWAIVYNLVSLAFGVVCTRIFKLPQWVTPAITFNNTTSLPLLLCQSLRSTGILDSVLVGNDTASAAIERAESYFLVNSMVSNSLTFAIGPRLLKPHDEDEPRASSDNEPKVDQEQPPRGHPSLQREDDVERAPMPPPGTLDSHGQDDGGMDGTLDEESSLLPKPVIRPAGRAGHAISRRGKATYDSLPPWAQSTLEIMYAFVNPPLIGAAVGAIIGVVPALHRFFFADTNRGGYAEAWLTEPIKNVGGLFATLQVVVVGVKLSQSLRKMKQGEESGEVPWRVVGFVAGVRFLVWPA